MSTNLDMHTKKAYVQRNKQTRHMYRETSMATVGYQVWSSLHFFSHRCADKLVLSTIKYLHAVTIISLGYIILYRNAPI